MRNRIKLILGLGILIVLVLSQGVTLAASANTFPDVIPLPNGFRPEGVVTGRGHTLYAGSLAAGAIYQIDLRTGEGDILVPPQQGRVAVGLGFDERTNYIYASGGPTGHAFVYDADTGTLVEGYELTGSSPTFINDVIVTRDAAYFTDSSQPALYKLPLSSGGGLPDQSAVETIPLGGDYDFEAGQFNANGIDATPNGKTLVIVNSFFGTLYSVNPDTGDAALIDLGGDAVPNGDGILLSGKTLYVVQNFFNQIAVVQLDPGLTSGEVTGVITDPDFDIPTTVARFRNTLYAVHARFSILPMPDTAYDIVKVRRSH